MVSDVVADASNGCDFHTIECGDKKCVSSTIRSSDGILVDDEENENGYYNEDNSEGETHWEKHLAMNQSVIVDTFQGQFKSTVCILFFIKENLTLYIVVVVVVVPIF